MRSFITSEAISPHDELHRFATQRNEETGALASFVGYCRGHAANGAIERIELEYYPGFTEAEIERLAQAVMSRHNLLDLLVIHRVGAIAANEPIVLVAALSPHRVAAFAAVSEMMDYLKTDAPMWKREVGAQGVRWIEPTAEDHARREEHTK
jgi:molybdopterin synthase catalytic subunit